MASSMRDQNGFTPTQARIVHTLMDGTWHSQQELVLAMDEVGDARTLAVHLFNIRKVLDTRSEVIVVQNTTDRGTVYRMGRLLAPMINGG